jgi:hypothetical protein
MAKEKFGIAVDEEIAREVDELVAECDDLGAGVVGVTSEHPMWRFRISSTRSWQSSGC